MSSLDNPNILTPPMLPPMTSVEPVGGETPGHGDVFSSALQANLVDGLSVSRDVALQQAVTQRIKTVKDATGQDLEDPTAGGYLGEAVRRFRGETGQSVPEPDMPGLMASDLGLAASDAARLGRMQLQVFQERVDDLAKRYPQGPDSRIGGDIQTAAKSLANQSVQAAQQTYQASGGGILNWGANLAGGMAAGFRDPLQVAALALGGGEGEPLFKSLAGQYLETFLKQGAINAGVQAGAEPGVQAWRGDRGEPNGVGPAIQDIGAAFLFGGTLGVGGKALGSLADRIRGGEAPSMRAPAEGAPDPAGEARQAVHSTLADREAAAGAPPGVERLDVAPLLRDTARRMEDPTAPLAEPPRARDAAPVTLDEPSQEMVRSGAVSPEIAAHVARMEADPSERMALLREVAAQAPKDFDSARRIVSDAIEARAAPEGLSRLLGQEQAPATRGLEAPREQLAEPLAGLPGVAAEGRVPESAWAVNQNRPKKRAPGNPQTDPTARIQAAMKDAGGGRWNQRVSLADLRGRLSDVPREDLDAALTAMHAKDSFFLTGEDNPAAFRRPGGAERQAAALDYKGEPMYHAWQTAEPGTTVGRPKMSAAPRRAPGNPQTLRAFIKAIGGVRDDGGDLRAGDLHREYPGLINNKRGLPMDTARKYAAEAGYFPEHGTTAEAMANTTPADLIDALRDSEPRYSQRDAAEVGARAQKTQAKAYQGKVKEAAATIDAHLAEAGEARADGELRQRAAEILAEGHVRDPGDALERAAIELYNRDEELRLANEEGIGPRDFEDADIARSDPGADYGGPRDGDGPGTEGRAAGPPEAAGSDRAAEGESAGQIREPVPLAEYGPGDVLSKVPVERDGKLEMVDRAEIGQGVERADHMATMIETCIL